MIVGNIVNCNEELDTKYFNCFGLEEFMDMGPLKEPTLLIGWEDVKKTFGQVSILSKMIWPETDDGYGALYWTFSPTEKRGVYQEDLQKFKERCYIDLIKHVKIHQIDPIIHKITNIDDLIKKLLILGGGIGYLFQERIVYIYKNNNIYVLDLELIDFIGFDRDKIIENLTNNLNIFGDDFEEDYTEELKHIDIKYTPYLKYRDAI